VHYCDCKGTTKLQLLQRVFQRMLTALLPANNISMCQAVPMLRNIMIPAADLEWYQMSDTGVDERMSIMVVPNSGTEDAI